MGVEPVYLQSELQGKKLVLSARGDWVSAYASEIEPEVDTALRRRGKVERVEIDAREVGQIDTIGAWLIERLKRNWEKGGTKISVVGLNPRFKVLLDEVSESNRDALKPPPPERPVTSMLEHIGITAAESWVDLQALVRFLGQVVAAAGRSIANPKRFRLDRKSVV